jgi:hypothetical protein
MIADPNALSQLYAAEAAVFKTAQLLKFLDKSTPNELCATLKTTGHLTKQILFVTGQTFTILSVPMHSTNATNHSAILGVHGNNLDLLAPAIIDGTRLDKCVSVLVPKSAAIKYNLPILAADPVDLDPPDTSGHQAGSQRLHFVFDTPEDAPVVALIPVIFAIPVGATIPAGIKLNAHPSQVVTAEMCPCEPARFWMTAMNHLATNHGGKSIHLDAETFKPNDFDLTPFAGRVLANTIDTPIRLLSPDDQQSDHVLNVVRAEVRTRRQLQTPRNDGSNTPPPPRSQEERDAITGSIRMMTEALKSVRPKESQADQEATETKLDAKVRYQLLLAYTEKRPDPSDADKMVDTFVLPELSDVFMAFLKTTKIASATRLLQEQFEHHLEQCHKSELKQDASVNLDPKMFDAPFARALQNADFLERQIALDTTAIKDKLTLAHFAPPRTDSIAYKQRHHEAQGIVRQEQIGEDKSRIKAKASDLDHYGRMDTPEDLQATVANFWALISFITVDAKKSAMWNKIKQLQDVWFSREGKQWVEAHYRGAPHLVTCLILECQALMIPFCKIASTLAYRQAVKEGKVISPKAISIAARVADSIISENHTNVGHMQLGKYCDCPLTYGLFRHEPKNPTKPKGDDDDRKLAGTGPKPDRGRNGPPDNPRNGPGQDLTQDQIEGLKKKGLLKWTNGSPPSRFRAPDIYEKNGPAGLTKLCMNFAVRGSFCKFGRQCSNKHITQLRDFNTDNKNKFVRFVTDHPNLQLANPGTN